ncbi:hypothetical protein FG386_001524 [Cryptosporidium ryanae]|uniref:uncharacterized protein n=1 Tax=Cryptosporidium ryanae TaxID=515981 RepID=UPI00351A25BF|nr:hypothetical protein FG386_001524 [Cryptosporidium ryanae]
MLSRSLLQDNINQHESNLIEYYIVNNSVNKKISEYLLVFVIILSLLLFYYNGINGILIIVLAITPSLIITYLLMKYIYIEIGIRSFSELFVIGSTFSTLITLVFEGIIFYVLKYYTEEEYVNDNNYLNIYCNCISKDYFIVKYGCFKGFIYCFIATIIKYILNIGLIEELSKLIGLFTIKYELYDLNVKRNFFIHYISSNYGYILSGIACSLGFATIENIAYLINCDNDIYKMLLVSIARGILSVPFHVSASGFSCILLSNMKLNIIYNNFGILILKLLCLMPTSILHGIYDTCLVLLMEFDISEENTEKTSIFINKKIIIQKYIHKIMSTNDIVISKLNKQNSFTNICFEQSQTLFLTLVFLFLAIISYVMCLSLFTYNWIHLRRKRYNRVNNNLVTVELYSNLIQG